MMDPVFDDHKVPFVRWLASYVLTVDFFKNTITLMVVSVYCFMMLMGRAPTAEFGLLVGMLLGFYFKK